jgi:phosphate:Na+ symporter
MLTNLIGGVGLFLIGMVLLTEGLKSAAGDGLKRALVRFTGGPVRSLLAGAGVTALVQSSSATTLTTIGFVSAGLLTFPQAVGVIFGANLGTTSTAWLVAVFGLKMSVLPAALPMVGVGALMRLLGRGRLAHAGLALAGFGLIFVGIDTLQAGMAGLATQIGPDRFPGHTLSGRVLLVLVGVVMTVVMQSSSAAVATTLAALSTGAIDVAQAGALVIGQNVGTTVTAGLAAIGASVPAQRTALAHVLFNVSTAVVAFAILPGLPFVAQWMASQVGPSHDTLFLAGFQTGFNLLGVLMLLPVIGRFSALVTRLVPDRGPALTRYLDRSVTRLSAVAVETAHRTLREILRGVVSTIDVTRRPPSERRVSALREALLETRQFLAAVHPEPETAAVHARHVAALHALDHLEQLAGLSAQVAPREASDAPALAAQRGHVEAIMALALARISNPSDAPVDGSDVELAELREVARRDRVRALDAAAAGQVAPDDVLRRLEAMRWLDAVAYHLHRALHHLHEEARVESEEPMREPAAHAATVETERAGS